MHCQCHNSHILLIPLVQKELSDQQKEALEKQQNMDGKLNQLGTDVDSLGNNVGEVCASCSMGAFRPLDASADRQARARPHATGLFRNLLTCITHSQPKLVPVHA